MTGSASTAWLVRKQGAVEGQAVDDPRRRPAKESETDQRSRCNADRRRH